MKKIILSLFFLIISSSVFSYQVELPQDTSDVRIKEQTIEVGDEWYKWLSEKVNYYLWFFMWTVSLAVVIYAWFLLMSSNGSDEDLKKANKMLVWGLVGIFVSLFAYLIVKLLIWLF